MILIPGKPVVMGSIDSILFVLVPNCHGGFLASAARGASLPLLCFPAIFLTGRLNVRVSTVSCLTKTGVETGGCGKRLIIYYVSTRSKVSFRLYQNFQFI